MIRWPLYLLALGLAVFALGGLMFGLVADPLFLNRMTLAILLSLLFGILSAIGPDRREP